jgi:protease-4
VKAVVLVSNSPGGGAAASERLYMATSRTAAQMPVVASVDAMAASGAYYAVAPAGHIFAKPSSLVGSVGVWTMTPTEIQPIDDVIATGPEKLSGGSERDWVYRVESLRRAFVGAVVESRGESLELSREELSQAGLYSGGQAVQTGLVDSIGGLSEAIRKAAEEAGLDGYDVEVMRSDADGASTKFISRTNFVASDASDKELVSPTYFVGSLSSEPSVPNVLMLPPSVLAAAEGSNASATPASRANVSRTNATVAEVAP